MAEPESKEPSPPTRPFLRVRGDDITGIKRPTNYLETIINMLKADVGTAIFAMGAAYYSSGIVVGTILLVVLAAMSLNCQHILVRAAIIISDKEVVQVLPTYAETVEYTFEDSSSAIFRKCSKAAGTITLVFLLMAEYGVDIIYLIFISTHIKEISDVYGYSINYRVWLAMLIVPIWISTFLSNFKYMVPFTFSANILTWLGVAIILYYSSQNLVPIKEIDLMSEFSQWPRFIGIALFAYEGITFILNIQVEMKYPKQFSSRCGVLNVAMVIVTILYFVMGFMSYWRYRDDVKGSVFQNLPHCDILAQVTKIGISLAITISYTIHMYIPFEIGYPLFHKKYGPFKHPTLVISLYKTFWVIVTYIVANVDNRLDSFIGLMGAISASVVTIIVPAFLELARLAGNLKVWIIIKNLLMIVTALIGAVTAAYVSVCDIVENIKLTLGPNETFTNNTC